MPEEEIHDHDRGLTFDLSTLFNRRRVLFGAAGTGALAFLAACGSSAKTAANTTGTVAASPTTTVSSTASTGVVSSTASTTTATTAASVGGPGDPNGGPPGGGAPPGGGGPGGSTAAASTTTNPTTGLVAVPEETAGPYPGDGSNGTQVLTASGIVRSNIRTSFGSSTTDATGVKTSIQLSLIDVSAGKPLSGAAVYIWHCDAAGRYSLYSPGATNENYLRGVQTSDADGLVTFQSYYPACYTGRWPHIHYEVYPSVDKITQSSNKIATSQMALPDAVNKAVFATSLYSASVSNYSQISLATDMVFSDGTTNETPTVTGDVSAGYTIAMNVPVSI